MYFNEQQIFQIVHIWVYRLGNKSFPKAIKHLPFKKIPFASKKIENFRKTTFTITRRYNTRDFSPLFLKKKIGLQPSYSEKKNRTLTTLFQKNKLITILWTNIFLFLRSIPKFHENTNKKIFIKKKITDYGTDMQT